MEINLVELWNAMGLPVRCVVVLLTLQATACVAVVIDRSILLASSSARAKQLVLGIEPALKARDYERVLSAIAGMKPSHLGSYIESGVRTFMERKRAGDEDTRAAQLAGRALERKGDAVSRDLNRGMNVLASTGSTAPFVGLLGTVLGIIHAFKLISATGSGGIGTIGSAIGESLIVTGYGLVVAIPAVLVFNWIAARIANYEAGMLNAGSELVDRLETGGSGGGEATEAQPDTAKVGARAATAS